MFVEPVTEEESFVLWNLSGRVRATRWLSVCVRGENLLAQRYENQRWISHAESDVHRRRRVELLIE